MSELKATPGPWTCARKHPHVWAIDALNGDPDLGHVKWHSLADVYGCDDMGAAGATKARANAYLIAAAPKMYKFLDDLANGRGTDYPIEQLLMEARGEQP